MRKLAKAKPQREPTIALINIVFLMLVFFMVAGTLAQPLDKTLTLVNTKDLEGRAPPDTLVVHSDGRLTYHGEDQSDAAAYVTGLSEDDRSKVRLVPDRELPAEDLMKIARDLRGAGAGQIMIVTERGLE
ncbi:MAG: biopolymer transporter ExbD [Litoreibacter sp.]|uniref:ExbD/TolR family protein n=1 Tax=Litoreibacter sp. TaxID=1969459 RepID=UPI003299054F